MTIDERLEALTTRHEALTESVELLLMQSREHTKQLEIDRENIRADSEHIRALARVAEIHERRLTDIEGGTT
ncbi:MAG: hypothetical protein M3Z23_00915 [Acidobacteriota bacterium]|nr:hypothetical protein [Acidobacteriota bacterium]